MTQGTNRCVCTCTRAHAHTWCCNECKMTFQLSFSLLWHCVICIPIQFFHWIPTTVYSASLISLIMNTCKWGKNEKSNAKYDCWHWLQNMSFTRATPESVSRQMCFLSLQLYFCKDRNTENKISSDFLSTTVKLFMTAKQPRGLMVSWTDQLSRGYDCPVLPGWCTLSRQHITTKGQIPGPKLESTSFFNIFIG